MFFKTLRARSRHCERSEAIQKNKTGLPRRPLGLLAMTITGVIPAQAGIYSSASRQADKWIPAFAGMTMGV